MFQSPSGDSLFSDATNAFSAATNAAGFNPLAGIRCFLTLDVEAVHLFDTELNVSIP